MSFIKRFGFMIITNFAIMATISIVMNLLGLQPYLSANGINYESLMVFCLLWGMGGSFISLMMSKWMAKKMMGVHIVDETTRFASVVTAVHRYAQDAGLSKMPEVGIYESPEVNAFATGPSRSNSLVAVSTGLLNNMSQDEIEGVLAHEVAHIANGDMVTMTLLQGVVNAFVMFFARIAAFAVQNALKSDDDDSPVGGLAYSFTVIAFDILFGILGSIVVRFFSRYREYKADAGGARLAGKHKMIAALEKLKREFDVGGHFDNSAEGIRSMKISSKNTRIIDLFSTHPKLDDRINALKMNNDF